MQGNPSPSAASRPDVDTSGQSNGDNGSKPSALKSPIVRSLLTFGAVLVLAAGGVWLFHWWTHGRFVESTDDAYLQADQVSASTRVAGFVEQVFVADNQAVTAGQQLVKLDERDPRARLEQAHAQADQARASIAQAQAQISQQEAQIAQTQANLAGARAQARFTGREAMRYAALAASGAETGERSDQMRQNRDEATAQVSADEAALLAAQRQIETFKAQIQQASAQVEQAEAQGRQAQVDLDATLVRASIPGRIGDKTVRIGQYVQPGTPMMTVVPVQNIYLVANFKETQIGRMRAGQPATINVDALSGQSLHGTVESFAPGTGAQFALVPPNNATGNFTKIVQRVPVRIRIATDTDMRKVLIPGLSVTVSVDTDSGVTDAKPAVEIEGARPQTTTSRQGNDPFSSSTTSPGVNTP